MLHLQAIQFAARDTRRAATFPFSIPSIASLADSRLSFTAEVTFLIGENGSGKSTFLEGLACAIGSITVGSEQVDTDPSLQHARQLAKNMKLAWTNKTRRGFFLRSEDFFGYAKHMK